MRYTVSFPIWLEFSVDDPEVQGSPLTKRELRDSISPDVFNEMNKAAAAIADAMNNVVPGLLQSPLLTFSGPTDRESGRYDLDYDKWYTTKNYVKHRTAEETERGW